MVQLGGITIISSLLEVEESEDCPLPPASPGSPYRFTTLTCGCGWTCSSYCECTCCLWWIYSFHLERINSFLLSPRDMHNKARFLRLKISLDSFSYNPVISPAKLFPPPFQEENLSEVPIVFYHTAFEGTSIVLRDLDFRIVEF